MSDLPVELKSTSIVSDVLITKLDTVSINPINILEGHYTDDGLVMDTCKCWMPNCKGDVYNVTLWDHIKLPWVTDKYNFYELQKNKLKEDETLCKLDLTQQPKNLEKILDTITNSMAFYSLAHTIHYDQYICTDCENCRIVCRACKEFCYLAAHGGSFNYEFDTVWLTQDFMGNRELRTTDDIDDTNDTPFCVLRNDIFDFNDDRLDILHENVWCNALLTGPDGAGCLQYICPKCNLADTFQFRD